MAVTSRPVPLFLPTLTEVVHESAFLSPLSDMEERTDAADRYDAVVEQGLMFGIRVAVQLPLYAAGATTALGLANIPLGLPLFLPVCAVTWLILRSTHPVREPEPINADTADAEPATD